MYAAGGRSTSNVMLVKEKHKATYMGPVGIGLALFVAELVGAFYTGGSLNSARSFGPCVTTGQFDPDHWVYWVGPALGAVIADGFIKVLEYEGEPGPRPLGGGGGGGEPEGEEE
ncbi:hypothetical protein LTR36_005234 [Oleoguttula mirabilis]|uniref:Aquaporin n=1 Tax=Oleoguttula mirabilis TaxID=1507867 RepID=A0AAV9JXY2_9PEZI|nr:hypothetical protein LTR36_005234 [Oleoguttula mirabilis]